MISYAMLLCAGRFRARVAIIRTLALLLTAFVVLDTNPATGTELARRAQDQVWLVSTRDMAVNCEAAENPDAWTVHYLDENGKWLPGDVPTLLAWDTHFDQTIVFVHGNRIERGQDRYEGLTTYRALVPSDAPQRVRFIIFSWPSGRIGGALRDFREKAWRTVPAAYHLAWLVSRFDPQVQLDFVGYSYGARIVTGALHLVGGGSLNSHQLDASRPVDARVVLIAAASDRDWLLPGGLHERAPSQMNHLLLLTNCCDPALKWYHLLDRCDNPIALGRWGLPTGALFESVAQVESCEWVGRNHDLHLYLQSDALMSLSWQALTRDRPAEVSHEVLRPLAVHQ
ncbi:MAG: hypothetical protein WDZ59_03905 [Pirellulales bacterium]